MLRRVLISLVLGVNLRLILYYTGFTPLFQKRVEVSTPLNSWLNVEEGLFLDRNGINPYEGDTFHETPFLLHFAKYITKLPLFLFYAVFIITDLLTAICLGLFASSAKKDYFSISTLKSKYAKDSKDLQISDESYGQLVFMAYFLNPFTILSSVALTTSTFGNLAISFSALSMIKGHRLLSTLSLSIAISQTLYPITLIFPLILSIYMKEIQNDGKKTTLLISSIKTLLVFSTFLGFIYISFTYLSNGDLFLDRIYGFILSVPDLKPNIGLFWYFFTEMFEHFHLLFMCTFQINAFIYVIPLTLRFSNEPPLLFYILCSITTIFKSYPCVGDLALYLSLLPMWKHLAPFMQQKFIVGCFFIATSVLAPVQWYLWIYSGSANANFYFGVTIALGTAQIFLITDVLLAYLKREYYLTNGMAKEIDGKAAKLSLN